MPSLEAAARAALPTIPALKDVDEPVLEYLSGLIGEEKQIKSAAHLEHLLNELLVSYDVIEAESEGSKICEQLFEKLVAAGVAQAPKAKAAAPASTAGKSTAAAPAATTNALPTAAGAPATAAPQFKGMIAPPGYRWILATEKSRARLQVGVDILARLKKDNRWYPAKIESTASDGTFVVKFPDHNNDRQTVDLAQMKVVEKIPYLDAEVQRELTEGGWKVGQGGKDRLSEWDGAAESSAAAFEHGGGFAIRKLDQAVVIGEFGITAADRADAALHATLMYEKAQRAKIFSKKELKERKRAELEVKREAARIKALEAKKFEALKRYLAADKHGKPTDVEIDGVGLSTPDGSQELLSNATLKFVTGRRYGLIGRNGVGKTSLMRAISSYDVQGFPVHLRVVHVEQEIAGDDTSVLQSVLDADVERMMLLEEERKLLRTLKAEEVAAAKQQADNEEQARKQTRAAEQERRRAAMAAEEADSVRRLGASVDRMLDSMKALDAELGDVELDDGGVDDFSQVASSTENDDEDEDDDAETAAIEAELKRAELEDEEDEDEEETAASAKKSNAYSKSKRGKVNKSKRDAARRKEREVELPEAKIVDPATRLAQIYARMNDIDAWGAEARARSILHGLQFSTQRQTAKTRELSGGWRQRVSLAQALFVNPDILLLDEPTNHLDFPAVLWLEQYLQKYEKTLIIVSHDRSFLDHVVTDTIHYYQRTLSYYRGNYTFFEKQRAAKIAQMKREFEVQKEKRAHIQQFIDKFRCSASRAALVQSRIKALARMDALIDVVEENATVFNFPEPDRIDGHILTANNVKFGYSYNKILLDKVTLSVDMDSRIGVVGANGVGKSTLIHLLIGKLQPISGSVSRNGSARIAAFAQHHVDGLDMGISAVDQMCAIFPGIQAQVFRRHLGCFGITGDLATNKLRTLSGGQKAKVAFAIVTWKKPHIVILDEPTNHLDLETIDALISAIQNYGGGLLFVSHDQNFLQSVGSEFWGVSNGQVKRFDSFEASKKFSFAASQQ